jgi:NitT/TauT family transport system substrate-binding protein
VPSLSNLFRPPNPFRSSNLFRPLLATTLAVALMLTTPTAQALEPTSIQLKWVYQAQFAGYIVAQQKGYYKAHGLEVTIKPGGPDLAPPQVLAGGGVDFAVDWLPSALAAREKGVPMVNIAQFFTRAGGMITCFRSSGITKPEDFKGKTIGVVFGGNEYPFLAWAGHLHLTTSGAKPDIKIIKLGFNVDPLLQHQADCIATQIYNEYYQILDAGHKPGELITFPYADHDVDTLEDGLYALGPKLADPKFAAKAAAFLAASIEGWKYAVAHPDEAAKIIVDNDPAGVAVYNIQLRQMKEIVKLVGTGGKGIGYLDPAAFDRTVSVLMTGGSTPIITKKPENAWTHAIWDKAETELK